MDGFGKGSYRKLWKAIEKSRDCELPAFIGSLGIAQMGKTTSKDVCKALDYDLEKLMSLSEYDLQCLDGVGAKTAKEIHDYFAENADMVRELAKEMHFKAMTKIDRKFIEVNLQPEVGDEAYDRGAQMLNDFFRQELQKYLTPELCSMGREIIECFMRGGSLEEYENIML